MAEQEPSQSGWLDEVARDAFCERPPSLEGSFEVSAETKWKAVIGLILVSVAVYVAIKYSVLYGILLSILFALL